MATTTRTSEQAQKTEAAQRHTSRRIVHYTFVWTSIVLITLAVLMPFVWAVVTSFKTQREALQPSLIPWVQFTPTMENWNAELGLGGREARLALTNSTVISISSTVFATLLGTITGYGLAAYKYGVGNRNLVAWFLSQRFLPPVATLIPFFLVLQNLNLFDTRIGLILVNTTFTLPFAVLIMRDFFADFPADLREAALVDGANDWQVFQKVALPVATPALSAAAIICFAFSWNEYLFASVLAPNQAKPYTFLVASTSTSRGVHFGFVSTRMLIAVTLPVILSLFVQRYIVRGLTMGAVKG